MYSLCSLITFTLEAMLHDCVSPTFLKTKFWSSRIKNQYSLQRTNRLSFELKIEPFFRLIISNHHLQTCMYARIVVLKSRCYVSIHSAGLRMYVCVRMFLAQCAYATKILFIFPTFDPIFFHCVFDVLIIRMYVYQLFLTFSILNREIIVNHWFSIMSVEMRLCFGAKYCFLFP